MKAMLRGQVAALMLLAPVASTFIAQPVYAQQRVAVPQIQSLSLNGDDGLDAGSQLRIVVNGTPGGRATVNFGKTDITVALKETQRGVYRGTYTVRRADRIDPTAVLNVRLARGSVVARHSFTYPPSFQALAMGAGPALAPPPAAVAEAPRIERFVAVPVGRIEPGRELRYRVHGLPGANVTLEIPGVVNGVAMREVSPGLYEASYTIRQRDDLDHFSTAIATLRSGNRWVTSRLDRAFVIERDNRAPTISRLTPEQGDIVSPQGTVLISGAFDDGDGRGVNPQSVRLTIDGRDVTPRADITPERFSYRSDLPPGRYTAEVVARDYAGNAVNRSWSFDVGHSRVGSSGLPLMVTSHPQGAVVDGNGNVFLQGRTAPFATVRVRVDAVPPVFGQLLGVAQTLYNDTVQADRDGRFSVDVASRSGFSAVPGTRYEVSLFATQGSQSAESRITLHQRS